MKIQCDVCGKEEASVFCVADEAAICAACDHRVHHANKLASKHHRFSLLQPSATQTPLCDVCQEKRAFLFCQQDRAMLCRDCDVPIHSCNEHTKKHDRFLLTGIKLSPTSDLYTPSKPALINGQSKNWVNNPVSGSSTTLNLESIRKSGDENWTIAKEGGGGSASSISEYLIETLPGWHVEDFLDSSHTPFGFSKTDEPMFPLMDDELENSLSGFWVPQETMGGVNMSKEPEEWSIKANNRGVWIDDGFTVPQIKRSRPFW